MILMSTYANIALFQGKKIDKFVDGTVVENVILGDPVIEYGTLSSRRIAFVHNFTPDQVAWINEQLAAAPKRVRDATYVLPTDSLPADWNYHPGGE